MSLPALTPLMPTLPASAQPSERQPPLPPVELPDEMATRDSVDERGRARFIPRGEESGQTSDSVRRGPVESSGAGTRAIPVGSATRAAGAGPEAAARKPGVVLSPAGINPRLLAMAFAQPIIQGLLGEWSDGRTVSLRIPANPGLPEPLAEALAQAASPALMKAILAVGMRQNGVELAAPPGSSGEPIKTRRASETTQAIEAAKSIETATRSEANQQTESMRSSSPTEVAMTDHHGGAVPTSTERKGDAGNPPILVSLTLLPLPVQPDRVNGEHEPNRKRGGQKDDESGSGLSGIASARRAGRMLRGQVDLGPRGLLNFEIRTLNGRFSVALGATPDLGAAARPGLPVLEAALNRVPGFTELHWNG